MGLRFVFNTIPRSKAQQEKLGVPQSCIYQPLRPKESLLTINSFPIACSTCHGIISPYASLDPSHQYWGCPFCQARNLMSANHRNDLQYVFDPTAMDIEYVLPSDIKLQSVFMFVIDLGLDSHELDSLKETLINTLELLPQDCQIGIITFGKNVNVYELKHLENFKCHSFNGVKSYSKDEVAQKLNLFPNKNASVNNRFIQSLDFHQYNLTQFIQSLKPDGFKVENYHRRERATGTALSIASNLLSNIFPKIGARIITFIGGPSTIGEGSIVDTPLKAPLRSHNDLKNDSKAIKRFNKAKEFYDKMGKSGSGNGHSFDIFVGCYDQIGLSEMECLVNKTGGVIVQSDSFTSAIFKQSLQRFLSVDSQFGLNGVLEIKTSAVKINGMIGNGMKIDKSKSKDTMFFNEKQSIGLGATNCWKLGSISNHSTYSIYYELSDEVCGSAFALFQFITSYQHPDGTKRVHVTTSQRQVVESVSDMASVCLSFDQEACTVSTAREAVFTLMNDPTIDVVKKYCDKVLIDVIKTFSNHQKGSPSSVVLPESMRMFPQFIYYLRRSNFVQIFNSSPDETSFYRHCFLTEDSTNSLIMIQPSLTAYDLNTDPVPVLLDTKSVQPDRILLLDTFFHILIYYGSVVAEWRREGYAEREEYGYLSEYFDQPRQDAADLLVDRFPLPRFIDTEEGGSQARFLMSKLNPSDSYKSVGGASGSGGAIALTDDVSLHTLMEYVYKAVTMA